MTAELEDLIACDLWIVGREVAGFLLLVFVGLGLPVRLDRQVAAAAAGGPAGMAGKAGHVVVLVRAFTHARTEIHLAARAGQRAHQLGARCLGVEIGVIAVDAVLHQLHPPDQLGIAGRPLQQHAAAGGILAPFKAQPTIGVAHRDQIAAWRRRGQVGGSHRRIGIGGAMTILAADLHAVGNFAMDHAVAVAILGKVAIGALHAHFGVDIHQVHCLAGLAGARGGGRFHELRLAGLPELFRIIRIDDVRSIGAIAGHVAAGIEQIAFAIALVHGAEIPAVAVIIGELGILHLVIAVVHRPQEIQIRPGAARRCGFGVALVGGAHFGGRGVTLLLEQALILGFAHAWRLGIRIFLARPHARRVTFIIPHRIAIVGVHEHVGLVHVAIHAQAGRHGAGKGVLDRVTAFRFRDRWIGGLGLPVTAGRSIHR